MTPPGRRSGRHGAPSRSKWAWAARFRSSPSSPLRSPRRRSWSPVWRIPRRRRIASTRACTWVCWSGPRRPRRCCWPTWPEDLDRQVAAQFGHVAGGLDVVLRFGDLALLVNDERRADHALNGLAVHLLFAVGAVGRQHLALGVRQQRKRQALGFTELGQLLWLVGGDADDIEA